MKRLWIACMNSHMQGFPIALAALMQFIWFIRIFALLYWRCKRQNDYKVFNIIENHRWKVLNTRVAYPGRWNDKTDGLFNEIPEGMQNGMLYNGIEFQLEDECYLW
jgi:hypothetical protein